MLAPTADAATPIVLPQLVRKLVTMKKAGQSIPQPGVSELSIDSQVIRRGFDGETCWVHARAGLIPAHGGERALAVMTLQKLTLTGCDVFTDLYSMISDDGGETWSDPVEQPELARIREPNGVEVVVSDFTPKWHAATGTLLGTGHIIRYRGDQVLPSPRRREISYATYDTDRGAWNRWSVIDLPDPDGWSFSIGAGCTQRVDRPDGDILLPVYSWSYDDQVHGRPAKSTVLRCRFDGRALRYVEHGDEIEINVERGAAEPSLVHFAGRYYMTIRNDQHGYVTVSEDGLHYAPPTRWSFDDGADLGNYNTQQHWLVLGDRLYLVYTRRGLNNDHVFRHRAPLVIARVDPQRCVVIRDSERILVPQRGARLGNFGITDVSATEQWVTVTEWMQPLGCERYGSDNSIYLVRLEATRKHR